MTSCTFTVSRVLCVLCLSWSLAHPAFAQDKSNELDTLFTYYNQHGMFNGVVLAAEGGEVVYRKAFGFSDFENKIPLDTTSVFGIGSTTKPFTALAIMMMNERGLLSYEDALGKFFPDFPVHALPITIRHLLTHTSGLPDFLGDLALLDKLPEVTSKIAVDALMREPALKFPVGSAYSYSNSNYLLLALIVEKVARVSYRSFLEENIFRPLGMKRTWVYDESVAGISERVQGYDFFWDKTERDLRLKAIGCGNIYSTVDDLFRFDQALYTELLLSRDAMQRAYDTTGLPDQGEYVYGMGWKIPIAGDRRVVYHNGAIGGFRCQLWRSLDRRNTLITLGNNSWLEKQPRILSEAESIMEGKACVVGDASAEELFYDVWYMKGFEAAMSAMRGLKASGFEGYYLHPWEMNEIGYFFLRRKEVRKAIVGFTFGVAMYPGDFNIWDSLGEAYWKAGDEENARANYKKALELNPGCETAKRALEEIAASAGPE